LAAIACPPLFSILSVARQLVLSSPAEFVNIDCACGSFSVRYSSSRFFCAIILSASRTIGSGSPVPWT